MSSHTIHKVFLSMLSCLSLWLAHAPWASGQSDHTLKLMESAKKEGKLIWYTSMNVSDSKQLVDGFERKYPFARAEVFRAGGDRMVNRITTETKAGRWLFDVVSASAINTLVQPKLLLPYVSPETKSYPRQFMDPAGHWAAAHTNYYVIGYNTSLVSEKEAPKDWEDLLDPKWKGKICLDQEEYEWYATLLQVWGKEKTERYMSALARQGIQWRAGHSLIAQLMSAGEFPVAIVFAHRIEDMKKNGAPVDWVNTVDPIVVSVSGIGVSAKPNNPATAKLFVDFVLSKEGQEMNRSFNRISPRPDVEPLSPKMDQTRLKLKVVPNDFTTRYNDHVREFKRIFGL